MNSKPNSIGSFTSTILFVLAGVTLIAGFILYIIQLEDKTNPAGFMESMMIPGAAAVGIYITAVVIYLLTQIEYQLRIRQTGQEEQ